MDGEGTLSHQSNSQLLGSSLVGEEGVGKGRGKGGRGKRKRKGGRGEVPSRASSKQWPTSRCEV